jgi:hypothetical protein
LTAYYPTEWKNLAGRIAGRWCPSFTGNTGSRLPDTKGQNPGTLLNFTPTGNHAFVASDGLVALDLDGVNDEIILTDSVLIRQNQQYCVSAWVNKTAIALNNFNGGVFRGGDTFLMSSENTGRLWARHNNVNVSSSTAGPLLLNAGWVQIGLQWDGVRANLIFNGRVFTSVLVSSSTAFTISFFGQQGNQFFLGLIDDLTIFNTSINVSDMQFLYEQGRGGGLLHEPPKRRSFFVPTLPIPVRRRSSRFLTFPG